MGFIYADIELISMKDLSLRQRGLIGADDVHSVWVKALVDTGSYMLSINEKIRDQLDLHALYRVDAEMADGELKELDVVGSIVVNFKDRTTICNAVVMPGDKEVLLGAIPMGKLDVVLLPQQESIDLNR